MTHTDTFTELENSDLNQVTGGAIGLVPCTLIVDIYIAVDNFVDSLVETAAALADPH